MKKYLIISFIFLLLMIGLILLIRHENRPMNHFTFPITLTVKNYTYYEDMDTLTRVLLNKIFLYDTMDINIYYVSHNMNDREIEIIGYIQKNPFKKHSYNIFIKDRVTMSKKTFLCHELIHLKQMEDGDLIQEENYDIYKGDTIYFQKISYEDRKYEIYAFDNEIKIYEKLDNILYK